MKTFPTFIKLFIVIILFASCQQNKDVKRMLSKSDTRKEVMNAIANNTNMSEEMKNVMFNKENACLIIKEKYDEKGMMLEHKIKAAKYKSDHVINSSIHSNLMVN